MTLEELDKDINKKIAENEEFVRYTFFELKVRHNLSEDEIDEVLRLARNKFENLGYRVYFTGAKYNYQGENRIVESNEYSCNKRIIKFKIISIKNTEFIDI